MGAGEDDMMSDGAGQGGGASRNDDAGQGDAADQAGGAGKGGGRLPLLVAGCGYAGEAIARLARERAHAVWVTSRSPERLVHLERDGLNGILLDASFVRQVLVDEPLPLAVISIPPGRGEAGDTETHAAMEAWTDFALRSGARRLVYLSATSVYGDHEGAEVSGRSACRPNTGMGERRLAAEDRFVEMVERHGADAMVLRLPGIYGPGRTIRDRLLRGDYRLADGGRLLSNRIFVDDIASATLTLLDQGSTGDRVIAVDDTPFEVIDLVRFACNTLGLPLPPSVPLGDLPARTQAFYMGSKRCTAPELHAMGWRPQWPSFREGLPEAWRREGISLQEKS